jgi:ATP-dependent exoDNAse (exonuclease V) alpha subunit
LRKYKKNIAEVFSEKIPLMCAFAITIHKSQGMTIKSKVLVNLKGVYNNELIYVAISRVIDFSLLRIYSLPELWMLKKVFKPNQTVIDYFKNQFNSNCYKMLVDDEKK